MMSLMNMLILNFPKNESSKNKTNYNRNAQSFKIVKTNIALR